MSWSDVEGCPAFSRWVTRSSEACEGFNWIVQGGTDTRTTYYFDATSGNLVAVIASGPGFPSPYSCVAGPTTFPRPNCSDPGRTCALDGGSD